MADELAARLGIDLGTSNTAAALACAGRVQMVVPREGPTDEGYVIPSYVAYALDGSLVAVGQHARRMHQGCPEQVIRHAKRLVGIPYDLYTSELATRDRMAGEFAGRVSEAPDGGCLIAAGSGCFTPTQVLQAILTKVRDDAQVTLAQHFAPETTICEVQVTVPATFDHAQRDAIRRAAEQVFSAPVRLLEEPLAALLAWHAAGLLPPLAPGDTILAVDIGAGTSDVVVARMGDEGLIVLCNHGDDRLGGWEMDAAIEQWVYAQDVTTPRLADLAADGRLGPAARGRLAGAIEEAKICCARSRFGRAPLATVLELEDGTRKALKLALLRNDLSRILEPVTARLCALVQMALDEYRRSATASGQASADSEVSLPPLDAVVVTGGPTALKEVRSALAEVFIARPDLYGAVLDACEEAFNPFEAVARGAAVAQFDWCPAAPFAVGLFSWEHGYREALAANATTQADVCGLRFAPGLAEVALLWERSGQAADCPVVIYHLLTDGRPVDFEVRWRGEGVSLTCVDATGQQLRWPPATTTTTFGALLARAWAVFEAAAGVDRSAARALSDDEVASVLHGGWPRLLDLAEASFGADVLAHVADAERQDDPILADAAQAALTQLCATASARGIDTAPLERVLNSWPHPDRTSLAAAGATVDLLVADSFAAEALSRPFWRWLDRAWSRRTEE